MIVLLTAVQKHEDRLFTAFVAHFRRDPTPVEHEVITSFATALAETETGDPAMFAAEAMLAGAFSTKTTIFPK